MYGTVLEVGFRTEDLSEHLAVTCTTQSMHPLFWHDQPQKELKRDGNEDVFGM